MHREQGGIRQFGGPAFWCRDAAHGSLYFVVRPTCTMSPGRWGTVSVCILKGHLRRLVGRGLFLPRGSKFCSAVSEHRIVTFRETRAVAFLYASIIDVTEIIVPVFHNHSPPFRDRQVGFHLLSSWPASLSPYPRFIRFNLTSRLAEAGPFGMLLLLEDQHHVR